MSIVDFFKTHNEVSVVNYPAHESVPQSVDYTLTITEGTDVLYSHYLEPEQGTDQVKCTDTIDLVCEGSHVTIYPENTTHLQRVIKVFKEN